jgi:hypothetical protein
MIVPLSLINESSELLKKKAWVLVLVLYPSLASVFSNGILPESRLILTTSTCQTHSSASSINASVQKYSENSSLQLQATLAPPAAGEMTRALALSAVVFFTFYFPAAKSPAIGGGASY